MYRGVVYDAVCFGCDCLISKHHSIPMTKYFDNERVECVTKIMCVSCAEKQRNLECQKKLNTTL